MTARLPLKRIKGVSRPLGWKQLEAIVGKPISAEIRDKINIVTQCYANVGPTFSNDNTVPATEVVAALDSWLKATGRLRRAIRLAPAPKDQNLDPADLTTISLAATRPFLALEVLAAAVRSADITGNFVKSRVSEEIGGLKGDLWSVWVCLIGVYFQKLNLKITVSSPDKSHHDSPFVSLIEQLQNSLPPECRRLTGYGSIAQGIKRARRTLGKLNESQLLLILAGWGSQVLTGYPGFLEKRTPAELVELKEVFDAVLAELDRER